MYIHQTAEWPNFTWDRAEIDSKLVRLNKAAGFLEGRLSAIGFDVQQQAVVEVITHDIVSSYEIESVALNTNQVRSSVARRMGVRITNETEPSHYVEGVVEMMLDAVRNYDKPLTDDRLFGWHNCLFPTGRSGLEVINVGKYRVDAMNVESGALGLEKIHYRAPEAEDVPQEMERFLAWFNSDKTPRDYVKSAVAHFWFVSIHPFDDGNGRISRAIADMALSQADNSTMRYFSISRQINKEKRKYNDMLERSQKGSCDITAWVDWYLDCMSRAIAEAEEMLSSILDKALFWQNQSQVVLSDREKATLNVWLDGYQGKLTVKNWAKQAKASVDTAARDIKDLVDKGVLVPISDKQRNVPYGIRVSEARTLFPGLEEGDTE
ncbi:MAG: Fic family protein [Bacteroidales bacterium]|nr:Fic family protein [Bacteroidales bacterium]